MGKYNSLAEFLYLYAAYYTLYALSFAVCGKFFLVNVYCRLILGNEDSLSEPLVENFGSLAVSVLTLGKLQTDYVVRIGFYVFLSLLVAYYIVWRTNKLAYISCFFAVKPHTLIRFNNCHNKISP